MGDATVPKRESNGEGTHDSGLSLSDDSNDVEECSKYFTDIGDVVKCEEKVKPSTSNTEIGDTDNGWVRVSPFGPESVVEKICMNNIVYTCKFYIEPKTQYYYYSSVLDERVRGLGDGSIRPLLASPKFDGGFNTEWRVLLDVNRWEGTTRWVSLYMSRLENVRDTLESLRLQCECNVVNKEGKVLRSLKTDRIPNVPNETNGFAKFLPFSDALKMLSDNHLHIQIHLALLHIPTEGDAGKCQCSEKSEIKDSKVAKETAKKSNSGDGIKSHAGFSKEHLATEYEREGFVFYPRIEEKDRVEFFLDSDSIGFADRNKLLKLSESYRYCVENKWNDCLTEMNFRRDENTNWMTINQYLQYVDDHVTKLSVCVNGSFMDLCQFIEFAQKMGTPKLEEVCANSMCLRTNIEEVAFVVAALRQHFHVMKKGILNNLRNFFRKNYLKLLGDPLSEVILNEDKEFFLSFLFEPSTSVFINKKGSSSECKKPSKKKKRRFTSRI